MRRFFSHLLPILGAAGFAVFSELSLRRPDQEFFLWSAVTAAWILIVFGAIVIRRPRRRLLWLAVPAVLMISTSLVVSFLFLDLVSPRHGFVAFFTILLYLFYEHVRHEVNAPDQDERLTIAEFARMVNIGSLFLIASVGIGLTIFMPVPYPWVLAGLALVTALWSLHLYYACAEHCPRPLSRVGITIVVVLQTSLVALRLPTSMFVGGALVGVAYYLCANLLPLASDAVSPRLIRRYVVVAMAMLGLVFSTSRWL